MKNEIALDTDKMQAWSEDGIGWMVFNNPARHNALSLEMQRVVPAILGAFRDDDSVRVVVMRGAGDKAFISGADISEFESRRSDPETIAKFDKISADASHAYTDLDKPIIGMIRGWCMGGGLLTALRADLRIASDDSRFGIPAARLGLGYGYGGVKSLIDLIGRPATEEILITAKRFNAEDAQRWGLVNRVVPAQDLEAQVKDLAATIADNAPLTLKALRYAIAQYHKPEPDLEGAERLAAACFASEDYKEGRQAFMQKRPPNWQGR